MRDLKLKLLRRNKSQRWLAKESKIPESYISMAIHGRYQLDPVQKMKIAQVLGCETSTISDEDKKV